LAGSAPQLVRAKLYGKGANSDLVSAPSPYTSTSLMPAMIRALSGMQKRSMTGL
jgi:hypothetical protein